MTFPAVSCILIEVSGAVPTANETVDSVFYFMVTSFLRRVTPMSSGIFLDFALSNIAKSLRKIALLRLLLFYTESLMKSGAQSEGFHKCR